MRLASHWHIGVGLVLLTLYQSPLAVKAEPGEQAPEDVLRAFMVGMMLQDETALREVTVPLEEDEFKWLLSGQVVPPEVIEQARKRFESVPIKRLQLGDEVKLPNRRILKVTDEFVGPDRELLQMEGDPLPFRIQRIDGQWRADPRHVIAGRKAADAARKKRAASNIGQK